MAAVNDVPVSLTAILSDLCDDTDSNLLYIHSVPKHCCKCITFTYNMNFSSTLTIWMPPSCQLTTCHVTKTAGIEAFFLIQKNDGARAGTNCLFKDRSGKSGSILQRSLSKLASDVCDPLSSDFSVVDCVNRKIKVWDLAAALDPRAPTGTLCVRTLVVSMAASCG